MNWLNRLICKIREHDYTYIGTEDGNAIAEVCARCLKVFGFWHDTPYSRWLAKQFLFPEKFHTTRPSAFDAMPKIPLQPPKRTHQHDVSKFFKGKVKPHGFAGQAYKKTIKNKRKPDK